jgi:lipopolysaccharide/colanic/teichoic acid biosynthesis glycosyltransferase
LFFRQARVGQCGRLFTMYKFRTMRLDAEPLGVAVWSKPSDPRVGFGGRFLRRTHIDEIPQFWNVLKGDMSIVGPRPERPELTPMLEEAIPHWTSRQVVKPGMTGLAQVLQGYAENRDESEQKLSYDLWYIRHRNLLLDLAICLWTIPSLVLRAAAPKPAPRDKAPACRTDGVPGDASLPSG